MYLAKCMVQPGKRVVQSGQRLVCGAFSGTRCIQARRPVRLGTCTVHSSAERPARSVTHTVPSGKRISQNAGCEQHNAKNMRHLCKMPGKCSTKLGVHGERMVHNTTHARHRTLLRCILQNAKHFEEKRNMLSKSRSVLHTMHKAFCKMRSERG